LNYLAHFHLAGSDEGFILGALLGDFVKGPLTSKRITERLSLVELPENTLAGIQLHRNIDARFDQLLSKTVVETLEQPLITPGSRRYLPIALDLFFDYALTGSWADYEKTSLHDFCQFITHTLTEHHYQLPRQAQRFSQRLIEHSLLKKYGDEDVLWQVANRINTQLPANNCLLQTLKEIFERQHEFIGIFENCYPQLTNFADQQRSELCGSFKESPTDAS